MKEAIGGAWLFTLVIVMIALFTTFVCVSTNYSRTYNVKDEIISIIESRKGINTRTIEDINAKLRQVGYASNGDCPSDSGCWYGFSRNSSRNVASYAAGVNYCIRIFPVTSQRDDGVSSAAIGHPASNYYGVMVFFQLDLPVIREIFHLRIEGETSIINLPDDSLVAGSMDCI